MQPPTLTQRGAISAACDSRHTLTLDLWACAYILGSVRQRDKQPRPYELGDRLEVQVRGAAVELAFFKRLCGLGFADTLGKDYRRIVHALGLQYVPAEPDFSITDERAPCWFDLKSVRCSRRYRHVLAPLSRMPSYAGGFAVAFLELGARFAYFSRPIWLPGVMPIADKLARLGFGFSDLGGRLGNNSYHKTKAGFLEEHTTVTEGDLEQLAADCFTLEEIRARAQLPKLVDYMRKCFRVQL